MLALFASRAVFGLTIEPQVPSVFVGDGVLERFTTLVPVVPPCTETPAAFDIVWENLVLREGTQLIPGVDLSLSVVPGPSVSVDHTIQNLVTFEGELTIPLNGERKVWKIQQENFGNLHARTIASGGSVRFFLPAAFRHGEEEPVFAAFILRCTLDTAEPVCGTLRFSFEDAMRKHLRAKEGIESLISPNTFSYLDLDVALNVVAMVNRDCCSGSYRCDCRTCNPPTCPTLCSTCNDNGCDDCNELGCPAC